MPYSRGYRRFRGRRRKAMRTGGIRRSFRGRRRAMTTGRVKRIIGAELKFRDLDVAPVPIPSQDGNISLITDIAVGDGPSQRNGNWIKPVVFRGVITVQGNDANVVDDTVPFRVGCFQWKENQDVDPATLIKLVQDTFSPHQGFNIQSKGSFNILWSRVGILSNNTDNTQFQKVFRFSVRPPMKILYDGAIDRKYHLFIFGFSTVNVGSEPPSYQFASCLRYTDS